MGRRLSRDFVKIRKAMADRHKRKVPTKWEEFWFRVIFYAPGTMVFLMLIVFLVMLFVGNDL